MNYNTRISGPLKSGILDSDVMFENFESLLLIDIGTDGFVLEDQNGNSVSVPSGKPIYLTAQRGELCRQIIVKAPLAGTMNISYLCDIYPVPAYIPPLFLYNDELEIITNDGGVIVDFNS